ncbi:MAG: hypothetical protein WD872_21255 [Pirellulaceae bacterium]
MTTHFCWLPGLCCSFALTAGWSATALADPQQWIQQLGAPEFSARQAASRKLSEGGRVLFPEVERAAETGSREVAGRAIDILRKHFERGDDQTQQQARESLQRLAKSKNPVAAQRAGQALNPVAPQAMQDLGQLNPFLPAFQRAGVRVQVGGIQIGRVAPAVNRRLHMRTVNGQREVELQEGDKTIKVRDTGAGGLEAEITERAGGQETTRKVQAKDAAELKQKDAEAGAFHERYFARAAGLAAAPQNADLLKLQLESIDKMIARTKLRQPNDINEPSNRRAIQSLERLKGDLEEQLKKLPIQLDDPPAAKNQATPADAPARQPN